VFRLRSSWRSRRLSRAAWLNERLLLLVGPLPGLRSGDVAATVFGGDQQVELEGRCLSYKSRAARKGGTLVILRLPHGGFPHDWSRLELRSGSRTLSIHRDDLESRAGDLPTLLDELTSVSAAEFEGIRRCVLSVAADELGGRGGFSLSKNLQLVRDALRQPLPEPTFARDEPQAVRVDTLLAIDETGFLIEGWTRDEDDTFDRLTVISPEGQQAHLEDAFRLRRPDVDELYGGSARQSPKHGFAKFFELPAPSPLETNWIVELRNSSGAGIQVGVPAAVHDAATAREALLKQFGEERAGKEEFRLKHLHPALVRLQDRDRKSAEIESVVEYGAPVESPQVSVVVTLYRRIDFIQHQLLQFAQDPAMRKADLIYVLDSPELADALSDLASEMHDFHRVPFRVVRLTRNAGFPIANNLGASVARGRLLLLLNSDVLPDRPGWLENMTAFYDATPEIGALGPKLLYEDDSIQHAGIYFEQEVNSELWGNLHYFKGFSRAFASANVNRPVPAVTGACFLIDRALYEEAGGLSHRYIQIGYEDSDLCLRLIARGRRNWYMGEVELYHLEGQVFPEHSREAFTGYNTWLQTKLWGSLIEEVMADEAVLAAAAASGPQRLRAG
jgi:GT2 family glycosyltransferase